MSRYYSRYPQRSRHSSSVQSNVTTLSKSLTVEQIQLQSLINSGLIHGSSNVAFATSVASARSLSTKQDYWVKKFIADATAPQQKPKGETVDISNVLKLFATAKNHMKFPKIWLKTKSGQDVRMSIAGAQSKYCGSLVMSTGSSYSGTGVYFGSISTSNSAFLTSAGKQIKDELFELLNEFNLDPAGVAIKFGKLTNKCCFCSLPLSTPESMAAGYGNVCAEHWNLPWGHIKITKEDVVLDFRANVAANVSSTDLELNGDLSDLI